MGRANAQAFARMFAYNELRLPDPQSQRLIDYSFPPATREVVEKLLEARDSASLSPAPDLGAGQRTFTRDHDPHRSRYAPETTPNRRALAEAAARVLNDALQCRDLFDDNYWPGDSPEFRDFLHEFFLRLLVALEESNFELVQRMLNRVHSDPHNYDPKFLEGFVSAIPDDDVTLFNRRLIECAFPGMFHTHPGLVFQTYYAVWLKRLLDIRLTDDDGYCLADYWPEKSRRTVTSSDTNQTGFCQKNSATLTNTSAISHVLSVLR